MVVCLTGARSHLPTPVALLQRGELSFQRGPPRASQRWGCEGTPQDSRPAGDPVLWAHNTAFSSLYTGSMCLSQHQAAKDFRLLLLLGWAEILGWDRAMATRGQEAHRSHLLQIRWGGAHGPSYQNIPGDNKVHSWSGQFSTLLNTCMVFQGTAWPPGPPPHRELQQLFLPKILFSFAWLPGAGPPLCQP